MHVILCCAILSTSYLDNNGCLKKLCEESNANDIETDHYTEELSPVMKRKQKGIGHLDFVLPTRNSIRKVVAEFSFTCCNDMAESLFDVNAKGQTVSYIPWYVRSWECRAW